MILYIELVLVIDCEWNNTSTVSSFTMKSLLLHVIDLLLSTVSCAASKDSGTKLM